MKKMLILIMLVTGMNWKTIAQTSNSFYPSPVLSKTDQIFKSGPNTQLRHRFIIALKNGNSIIIQVPNKISLEKILNLESLLLEVHKNLEPLRDSLAPDLSSKSVDYMPDQDGKIKLRIRSTPPNGNIYVLMPGGPAALKVEQDTLQISSKIIDNSKSWVSYQVELYRITVLINNLSELPSLLDGSINTAMQQLKKQWDGLKKWDEKNNSKTTLTAFFNIPNPAANRPMREPYISDKVVFTAYVQVGIQNINNTFVSSAGAGFLLRNKIKPGVVTTDQLFWEPYFVFDKNPEGKFRMQRNDFITYQHLLQSTFIRSPTDKVEFSQNFSAGWLAHRSGNFFKENTFKFGLPGARYKFLHLHPEFIFNDLFKNFQPGLKLFLDLD